MRRAHARLYQRGLSLIELMIALVLGVFVVGALIALYINSKESYILTENMARLQESGRFAMSLVSRDLRWADYRQCVSNDLLSTAVAGTNDAGLNSSDTITTVYQSNACAAAPATVTTVYSIQAGNSGAPALFRSINGGAAVELVEGIQDMQVLYGEDTDSDFIPNYYVAVGSVVDMAKVVAVRITLTARTLEAIRAASNAPITRNFTSTVVLRNRVP